LFACSHERGQPDAPHKKPSGLFSTSAGDPVADAGRDRCNGTAVHGVSSTARGVDERVEHKADFLAPSIMGGATPMNKR
jgi:hypothetical protein